MSVVAAPDSDFTTLVQGPSMRKRRRKGDLYVAELRSGGWLAARIAEDDAVVGGMQGMYVLYVYAARLADPADACQAATGPPKLLLPPLIVNRSCWTAGFLQFAASSSECPGELWESHVFHHSFSGQHFDAHGALVPPEGVGTAVVGVCKVHTALGLDVLVGRALTASPDL